MSPEAARDAPRGDPGYVLVIGSANVDVSVSTEHLPAPGETVIGDASVISLGGKGANQAVAAARCGADTRFVGRIGSDAFGEMVRAGLHAAGVDTTEIHAPPGLATGLAAIYVDATGQNCIVVVPGANAALQAAEVEPLRALLAGAAVLVLQCEIPMLTVYRCIELAAALGTPVILNPAPYRGLDLARIGAGVTYLVPNETEAALAGNGGVDTDEQAVACGQRLRDMGIPCVIITLGARGCLVVDERPPRLLAAPAVGAVDATGAGDAFIGCLAASLARGYPRDIAIQRALLYASLSTTRRGAQVSYPSSGEFEQAWQARAGLSASAT